MYNKYIVYIYIYYVKASALYRAMLDEIACSHPTILSSSAIIEDSERDTSDAFAMGTCVPITTASWPEDLKQPYPGTWWYVSAPSLPNAL